MRLYESKIHDADMELLSKAYFGYMAKKDIQAAILTGEIKPSDEMKTKFDEEFAIAYEGYEKTKDYITNEVLPELRGKNFNWTADFTNGTMVITWNGEGNGPELPSEKYIPIVSEV